MKNNQSVSRKDVAELAGVTETIVSYVLNNNRAVKKEKREAVLNAVKVLNYKPNRFARALKGKSSKHILLLLDRIKTEVLGELISDIDRISEKLGYMISISIIENSDDFVRKINDWQVDGVVVFSTTFEDCYIQQLVDTGIAVVVFQKRYYNEIQGAIIINPGLDDGTIRSVDYLYKTGCRKIAYVDGIFHNTFSNEKDVRYSSYQKKIKELNLEPIFISGCHSPEELISKLYELFKAHAIDGLFCKNDTIANICLNAARSYGIGIPEKLSVIGLDDSYYAKTSLPPLSSVRLDREALSLAAVNAIENYIAGVDEVTKIDFKTDLILRESTKPISK